MLVGINFCHVDCDGVIYQGICLKVATTRGWRDVPPVNCFPYHPARSWTLLNYVGICKETLGKASCRLGSTKIPGSSKCLNHRAIVIFGYDADLPWVNAGSFGWMPTPDCQRYSEQSNTTLTKVYACYHNCSSTAGQSQMVSWSVNILYHNDIAQATILSRIVIGCAMFKIDASMHVRTQDQYHSDLQLFVLINTSMHATCKLHVSSMV